MDETTSPSSEPQERNLYAIPNEELTTAEWVQVTVSECRRQIGNYLTPGLMGYEATESSSVLRDKVVDNLRQEIAALEALPHTATREEAREISRHYHKLRDELAKQR